MSPPAQSGRNESPTFLRGIAPLDAARTTQRVVPTKDSVKGVLPKGRFLRWN
jgi:hypothetical protein